VIQFYVWEMLTLMCVFNQKFVDGVLEVKNALVDLLWDPKKNALTHILSTLSKDGILKKHKKKNKLNWLKNIVFSTNLISTQPSLLNND